MSDETLLTSSHMQRTEDWLRQSKKDLQHAIKSERNEDYEWSCFSAQQAAEKSVKALFQALRAEAIGHSVSMLLKRLPKKYAPNEGLISRAKILEHPFITEVLRKGKILYVTPDYKNLIETHRLRVR